MLDQQVHFPHWSHFHTICFDFDGVFTNNKVWVDQNGIESVCCDRSDGLGLDMLAKFISLNKWRMDYFILSKEKNPVVMQRANKLNIDFVQAINNKKVFLVDYLIERSLDPKGLLYIGNDLNDLPAIQYAGFSVAPCDAHDMILSHVDLVLPQKGGDGFVRAFIEILIGLDKISADEIADFF